VHETKHSDGREESLEAKVKSPFPGAGVIKIQFHPRAEIGSNNPSKRKKKNVVAKDRMYTGRKRGLTPLRWTWSKANRAGYRQMWKGKISYYNV